MENQKVLTFDRSTGTLSTIRRNISKSALTTFSPRKETKMMDYEEVKVYADKYLLSSKLVYSLHSEFNCLCEISSSHLDSIDIQTYMSTMPELKN